MKHILICIFFSCYFLSHAQEYYNDARLWLNIYLEKKITKNFLIHLNQKDRFDQNISHFELGYADMGVTYKFNKNIKVLADYVFALNQKNNNSFDNRHQFYTAIIFSKEFQRWKFMYRNMFQVQYKNIQTSKNGYIPYYYDRNKFTIKYEATKRFEFYIAEELYLVINNPQAKGLSRSRTFGGMFIRTTRTQQLELYFCFQAQLQKVDWYKQYNSYPNYQLKHDYIYGIGYSFEF